MKYKRNVSQKQKDRIIWRDQWTCRICEDELLPMRWNCDHVVPLWEGGDNEDHNLQAICANCHAEKSCIEAQRRREERRRLEMQNLERDMKSRRDELGITATNIDLEIFRYDPNNV